MPSKPRKSSTSNWVEIVSATKTYLGFFVVLVLVVEGALGAVALRADGLNQLVAVAGMLGIILTLIAIVAFFAHTNPEPLLRSMGDGSSAEMQSAQTFCRNISGDWWERITPGQPSALSFMKITPDPVNNTVKMGGQAYSKDGKPAAMWETIAACVVPNEQKVIYYWKGWLPTQPNDAYEGYGHISFGRNAKGIVNGVGVFLDLNVTNMQGALKKSCQFWRSTAEESAVMAQIDDEALISTMVMKKLGSTARIAGD